jgi:hypothetical protein
MYVAMINRLSRRRAIVHADIEIHSQNDPGHALTSACPSSKKM